MNIDTPKKKTRSAKARPVLRFAPLSHQGNLSGSEASDFRAERHKNDRLRPDKKTPVSWFVLCVMTLLDYTASSGRMINENYKVERIWKAWS